MRFVSRDLVRAKAPRRATIRCSLGDHLVRGLPVTVAFFYDRTLDADALADALSTVLGPFHPFDAVVRVRGDDLVLDCDDGGVAFDVVRRDCTMRQALDGLLEEGSQLVDLVDARRDVRQPQPVLTVRVTHFIDGKTCVGVCWRHCVGDMHSFMMLMHAWSAAHEGRPFDEPVSPEDRDAFLGERLDPDNGAPPMVRHLGALDLARLVVHLATSARRRRPVAFYFGEEEIAALHSHFSERTRTWLSPNDALSAHVFALAAACDSKQRARKLSLVVDYRKRMGLPSRAIGNFITTLDTTCSPGKAPEAIAAEIRGGLGSFRERHVNYHSTIRFMRERGGAKAARRFVLDGMDPVRGNLFITNWSNFGVYDVRFGGSAPQLFTSLGGAPLPWLSSIFEGFENRGRIWSFMAPNDVADRLCTPEVLAQMHRFRPPQTVLPEAVARTPWLR